MTLSRPFNDDFTHSLFKNLLSTLPHSHTAYYMWSNPPSLLKSIIENNEFTGKNVIIGIKDLLDMWTEFQYWDDTRQPGTQLIIDCAKRFPDINFVLATSLENLSAELDSTSNLQILEWGGDLNNQYTLYPTLEPVLDKNFDSIKPFINLNRQNRNHRVVLLSYLFGLGYQDHGHITYLTQSLSTPNNLLDRIPWRFEEKHNQARQIMIDGYERMKATPLDKNKFEIYQNIGENNNFVNFNNNLRPLYTNSFVEIVSETTFAAPSYLLTEKTLNTVYGCNFPILITGAGAVAHLREIGFDMFDDIVNHSYDLISNPMDRIIAAVDNNSKLLTDADYAKEKWLSARDRFLNNIEIAKTDMYQWYKDRATKQFNQLTWNI